VASGHESHPLRHPPKPLEPLEFPVGPPIRSAAGYRHYTESTVEELRFIKKAQSLGFSLDEIGEILKLTRAGKTPLVPTHCNRTFMAPAIMSAVVPS
ncbi:MAG: MerR family transcriptional regulator, partial [Vicinamibacterales bacterium]